ncbi:MAG: T9SS type A sorting domain-containing protein, partial [Muribaculaceae bacterium]
DEANGHLYIYIEKTAGDESTMTRGGLYRIDLAKLYENPDPANLSALDPVLIDGSPVKYEGSNTNEHVGITQLAFDAKHEYLYWCYRAPSAEEAAANEAAPFEEMAKGKYWWAEKYDANNPLHHSGIKRIKLGQDKPTVEMVVEGVNGYGIVPVNYEGSTKPGSGVAEVVVNGAKLVSVANNVVAAAEDVEVAVYDLNGVMVGAAVLAAGQEYAIDNLAAGAYVINAVAANGDAQAVKYIKK